MRRAIAVVACGLAVLGGVGCNKFSYVQKDAHGGVIELKASDREAAIAKLQQQEGEIEIENIVPKGKPGQPFDPNTPVKPSDRMASTATSGFGSIFASKDEEKVQIKYTKKPMGTATGGLPLVPKDDGLSQAGFKTNSAYDRTPGAGMATVGGQKSSTALPVPNFSGLPQAK
jgi:hypothetical protein